MTGGTNAHETIGGTLRALLHDRLRGKRCRVRGPTLTVEVAGRIRHPDAFVFRTAAPGGAAVVKDPVVIFEVLSPGTSRTDRIEKPREYQATASVQRYVILEPDSIAATDIFRRGEDWIIHSLIAGDTLEMPEIEAAIPLSDIYADVELALPESEKASAALG